jgi:transcription elongation GreA/GreB family factor
VPANPRGSERIDKQLALRALEQRLAEELEAATAAHRQTTQGATHEESRAENDKDTRALEATYLARGQAKRVAELSDGLARLASITSRLTPEHAPVRLGALVEIEHDLGTLWYLLAPAGGGQKLVVNSRALTVITPESPVGRALLGHRVGDDVQIRTPQGVRECSVVSVS